MALPMTPLSFISKHSEWVKTGPNSGPSPPVRDPSLRMQAVFPHAKDYDFLWAVWYGRCPRCHG